MKYYTLLRATYSVTESLFRQRRAYNSLLVNFDLKITASPGHYSPGHYSPVNNVSIMSPLVTIVVVTLHESAKICLSYSWNYGSLITLSYMGKINMQNMPPVTHREELCEICLAILHNIQPLHYLHGKDLCKSQKRIYILDHISLYIIGYDSHHHCIIYVLHKSFPST